MSLINLVVVSVKKCIGTGNISFKLIFLFYNYYNDIFCSLVNIFSLHTKKSHHIYRLMTNYILIPEKLEMLNLLRFNLSMQTFWSLVTKYNISCTKWFEVYCPAFKLNQNKMSVFNFPHLRC